MSGKIPAEETYPDDGKPEPRERVSYADKGSHGARHNHTDTLRKIEKADRREKKQSNKSR